METLAASIISDMFTKHGLATAMLIIMTFILIAVMGALFKLWMHTTHQNLRRECEIKDVRDSAERDRDHCRDEIRKITDEQMIEREGWRKTFDSMIEKLIRAVEGKSNG